MGKSRFLCDIRIVLFLCSAFLKAEHVFFVKQKVVNFMCNLLKTLNKFLKTT